MIMNEQMQLYLKLLNHLSSYREHRELEEYYFEMCIFLCFKQRFAFEERLLCVILLQLFHHLDILMMRLDERVHDPEPCRGKQRERNHTRISSRELWRLLEVTQQVVWTTRERVVI